MSATGVVTPEAVRLELETAGVGTRLPAYAIDLAVQIGLLLVGLFGAFGIGQLSETVATVFFLLWSFAVLVGYPILFETLWRGRTLGKAALGLRVVTQEGGQVGLRHAAIRAFVGLFEIPSTFAALFIAFTERDRRLGDMVAGTLVLRERQPGQQVRSLAFEVPPSARSYAATVDVAVLDQADYQTVREFLGRRSSLDPGAREALGVALAQRLAGRTNHVPPADVSPELFLQVIAARFQERGAAARPAPAPSVGAWPPAPPVEARPADEGPADERPAGQRPAQERLTEEGSGGFAPPA